MHTITGDCLHGIATATMNILTGQQDIVVVEAHSKASNIKTLNHIVNFAMDPVLNRPLNLNPNYVAGLEMQNFLYQSKTSDKHCAEVVVKNKRNALNNDISCYGATITAAEVLQSSRTCTPLTRLQEAKHVDGAIVFVLANAKKAKKLNKKPVWIKGCGWISDSPTLETRNWDECEYAKLSAKMAYKQAGIKNPSKQIDLFEVDDHFAYKELQHLEAIGVYKKGMAGKALLRGDLNPSGKNPTNVSGGTLGIGSTLEASGGYRTLEIIKQLRGEAGKRQLKKANTGLALSWRGVPSSSGVTIVYSRKGA
jgi:acetyl-CoA C-acetyltransferase